MSLSDKICRGHGFPHYHKSDVKKFIKDISNDLCECEINNNPCRVCRIIEKRAGKELIEVSP